MNKSLVKSRLELLVRYEQHFNKEPYQAFINAMEGVGDAEDLDSILTRAKPGPKPKDKNEPN